jgi:sugar lactone lactonase YvrE
MTILLRFAIVNLILPVAWAEQALFFSTTQGPNYVINKLAPDGTVTTFASGLGAVPFGLAFDAAGNLYAATNYTGNSILKITPTGQVSTFAAGLDKPLYLAFDANGNLYSSNNGNGTISKITPDGSVTTFASGLGAVEGPFGLAFDSSGNLYAAGVSPASGYIYKITPSGAVSTFATTGNDYPFGLAFDAAGSLFVGAPVQNNIVKITPGGSVSRFVTGSQLVNGNSLVPIGSMNGPYSLAFDSEGNLFASDNFGNTGSSISKISADGTFSSVISGYPSTFGIAFAPTVAAIPEPSTYAVLFGLAVLLVAIWRRRMER